MDIERRHFIRCRVDEPVAVRLIPKKGTREVLCRLVDISTGGVQVIGVAGELGPDVTSPGQIATVRIVHAGTDFEADATAMRSQARDADDVTLSLAFTRLDEDHVEQLQRFLDALWDSCKVGGIRLEEGGSATTAYVVGAMAPSVCADLCSLICTGQIDSIDLTACLQIGKEGAYLIDRARRLGLRIDNCHAEIPGLLEGGGDYKPQCEGCRMDQGEGGAVTLCRDRRIERRPA